MKIWPNKINQTWIMRLTLLDNTVWAWILHAGCNQRHSITMSYKKLGCFIHWCSKFYYQSNNLAFYDLWLWMTPDRMGPGDELGSTESRLKTSFTLVQALPRDLELERKRQILHFYIVIVTKNVKFVTSLKSF